MNSLWLACLVVNPVYGLWMVTCSPYSSDERERRALSLVFNSDHSDGLNTETERSLKLLCIISMQANKKVLIYLLFARMPVDSYRRQLRSSRCCLSLLIYNFFTVLFHVFSPDCFYLSIAHSTGRLTHTIHQGHCLFKVMGQETC